MPARATGPAKGAIAFRQVLSVEGIRVLDKGSRALLASNAAAV
jgi:hypothetical protein